MAFQRVSAAHGRSRDGGPQPLVLHELREALIQRTAPSGESVDSGEQIDERDLSRLVREPLAGQSAAVLLVQVVLPG